MAKGVPIVKPSFIRDLATCIKSKQAIPDPAQYVPRLAEQSLNADEIDCGTKAQRRTLFSGLTFLFFAEEQKDKYAAAIGYAGGAAAVAADTAAADTAADDDVVVVQPPRPMVERPTAVLKRALARLKRAKLSAVPEASIGIAVLKCSVENDCNPRKKPVWRSFPARRW